MLDRRVACSVEEINHRSTEEIRIEFFPFREELEEALGRKRRGELEPFAKIERMLRRLRLIFRKQFPERRGFSEEAKRRLRHPQPFRNLHRPHPRRQQPRNSMMIRPQPNRRRRAGGGAEGG